MKRALFETAKVIPDGVGTVINRSGFLSAILGINVSAGADKSLAVQVQHCDTEDGEFAAVDDSHIGVDGKLKELTVNAGDMINVDIDLLACREYIKIVVITEATAAYALTLGDPTQAPV
ncbi:MAG: hypothetical protein ACRDBO_10860 [Lachnospiraceae bacterium]